MADTRVPSLGPRGEGWVVGQGILLLAVRYAEYEAYRRRTHRFIPGAY